jgi:hypothetical protein
MLFRQQSIADPYRFDCDDCEDVGKRGFCDECPHDPNPMLERLRESYPEDAEAFEGFELLEFAGRVFDLDLTLKVSYGRVGRGLDPWELVGLRVLEAERTKFERYQLKGGK